MRWGENKTPKPQYKPSLRQERRTSGFFEEKKTKQEEGNNNYQYLRVFSLKFLVPKMDVNFKEKKIEILKNKVIFVLRCK